MPDFTEINEKEEQHIATHKSVNWLRIGILAGIVPALLFAVTPGE